MAYPENPEPGPQMEEASSRTFRSGFRIRMAMRSALVGAGLLTSASIRWTVASGISDPCTAAADLSVAGSPALATSVLRSAGDFHRPSVREVRRMPAALPDPRPDPASLLGPPTFAPAGTTDPIRLARSPLARSLLM